ncbi:unnamed protein product, partial [Closterium sp. NIES-64]
LPAPIPPPDLPPRCASRSQLPALVPPVDLPPRSSLPLPSHPPLSPPPLPSLPPLSSPPVFPFLFHLLSYLFHFTFPSPPSTCSAPLSPLSPRTLPPFPSLLFPLLASPPALASSLLSAPRAFQLCPAYQPSEGNHSFRRSGTSLRGFPDLRPRLRLIRAPTASASSPECSFPSISFPSSFPSTSFTSSSSSTSFPFPTLLRHAPASQAASPTTSNPSLRSSPVSPFLFSLLSPFSFPSPLLLRPTSPTNFPLHLGTFRPPSFSTPPDSPRDPDSRR